MEAGCRAARHYRRVLDQRGLGAVSKRWDPATLPGDADEMYWSIDGRETRQEESEANRLEPGGATPLVLIHQQGGRRFLSARPIP